MKIYGVSFEKVLESKVFYLKRLIRKGDALVWTTDRLDFDPFLEFESIITAKKSIFHADAAEISQYVRKNGYAFLGQRIGDVPYQMYPYPSVT